MCSSGIISRFIFPQKQVLGVVYNSSSKGPQKEEAKGCTSIILACIGVAFQQLLRLYYCIPTINEKHNGLPHRSLVQTFPDRRRGPRETMKEAEPVHAAYDTTVRMKRRARGLKSDAHTTYIPHSLHIQAFWPTILPSGGVIPSSVSVNSVNGTTRHSTTRQREVF